MFGSSKLKTPNKLRGETPNRFGTFLKNRKNKVWGFLLDKVRKVKGEWEPERRYLTCLIYYDPLCLSFNKIILDNSRCVEYYEVTHKPEGLLSW
jgi:hypothetical protein